MELVCKLIKIVEFLVNFVTRVVKLIVTLVVCGLSDPAEIPRILGDFMKGMRGILYDVIGVVLTMLERSARDLLAPLHGLLGRGERTALCCLIAPRRESGPTVKP